MSWCEVCREHLSREEVHAFAGWGFYLTYCAKHCPREMDGTECDLDHEGEGKEEAPPTNDKPTQGGTQ